MQQQVHTVEEIPIHTAAPQPLGPVCPLTEWRKARITRKVTMAIVDQVAQARTGGRS